MPFEQVDLTLLEDNVFQPNDYGYKVITLSGMTGFIQQRSDSIAIGKEKKKNLAIIGSFIDMEIAAICAKKSQCVCYWHGK
ncbi:18501_t:CDS:2, partial [Gigaspora margarita]